jgi:hypothetical protein
MSVITNWPAVPNRLYLLLKQLASQPKGKGITRENLAGLMNPPSLTRGKKTNILSEVLSEAMRLNLVVEELAKETGEKRLQLASDVQNLNELGFIRLMEQRLLQEPRDPSLNRGRFPEALTWFLMQDPLKPLMWDKNFRFIVETDMGEQSESFELTNKAGFQNLLYWARFLGYAVKLGFTVTELNEDVDVDEDELQTADQDVAKATAYVLPDPTVAISRHLPAIFGEKSQLSVDGFIEAWAPFLPVLEGGAIYEALERQVRPELARQAQTFSRTSSLALRRLAQRGVINLQTFSDANMYLLDYGRETSRVSHIAYFVEKQI